MGHLRLGFLGTPLVEHEGQGIKFPTRKALALLIYLAVEGSPISREKLISLLWPESDTSRGRTALRTTLTQLRETLQESSGTPHLLIEQDTLGLNPQAGVDFDLHRLEEIYLRARPTPAPTPANLRELRAQLQNGLGFSRGNFLEGFGLRAAPEFDDWASQQREKWHQRLSVIFDRLTQLQFEGGEIAGGLETVTQWLAHDSLNETAYRRLMLLHLAAGNRPAALQAYENCRAVLRAELNADPSRETETLARRIETQAVAVQIAEVAEPPTVMEAPLVGRLNEHAALAAAYRTARRGEAHVVSVVGEPGIGKSRLVREFAAWAVAQGADVLLGEAFEAGGSLPYQPIVQAIRSRLSREPNAAALLAPVWLAELTRLLPELRAVAGDNPLPANRADGEARLHLFEAVAQLIVVLARQAPLVVCMDDLHWADAASRDLVRYLAKRCAETQAAVLFILVVRSEELSGALQEWLLTIERTPPARRLALGLLTFEDTQQIAAAFLAQREMAPLLDPEGFTQKLFAETAGQPLFVVEMLRAWLDDVNEAAHPPLAAGIRALIVARLSRLSALGRLMLTAAAVLAQQVSFENLMQMLAMGTAQASQGLDELLARGLLRETRGRIQFTHEKIREVTYAEAGTLQRRSLHRQAGETLEQLWHDQVEEQAAVLAYHYDAADDGRAVKYYALAGDTAARVYANAEAARHYARALEIAKQGALTPDPTLYLRRGRVQELDAHFDEALANYEEMAAAARQQADPAMELNALIAHNTIYAMPIPIRDSARAEATAGQALQLARQLGDQGAEARILWNLMLHARHNTHYHEAIAYGEKALTIARMLGLREQLAYTLHDLSSAYMFSGLAEQAQAARKEAADLWREFNNLPLLAESLVYVSIDHCLAGEFAQSIAASQEAYGIGQQTGNRWAQSFSLIAVGMAHRERGEIGQALEKMAECVQLAEQVGLVPPQAQTRAELARLYGDMGQANQGIDLAQLALAKAEELFPTYRLYALGVLAQLLLRTGKRTEAEALVALGWPEFGSENLFPLSRVMLGLAAIELARAQRDYAGMLAICNKLEILVREVRMRIFGPSILHFKGQACYWLNQREEALIFLEKARDEAEAIGAHWSLWPILMHLAEIEAQNGHTATAQGLQQQAQAILNQIAEQPDNAEWRDTLLGLPASLQSLV